MSDRKMPESVGQGLDGARTRIDAAREAMIAILERDIDVPEFRQAIDRLDRVEAELARIEGQIAVREGLAG
jgi:hypothetical protein